LKPRIYPSRTKRGKRYNVLAPKYLSFSNIPVLNRLNDYFFKRSVQKAYRRIKINIDFIYAHFLFGPGRAAKRLFFKWFKLRKSILSSYNFLTISCLLSETTLEQFCNFFKKSAK